jgi:hypothetical protein
MAELCTNNKHFNIEHLVKIADVLEVDILLNLCYTKEKLRKGVM